MKKHVLLVDDDSVVCKLLRSALEKNDFITTTCNTGEDALLQLEQSSLDAVILDIMLPGIDGLGVLRKIRSHSIHSQLPVIMLTSKDSEIETVLGLELGADDYLSKPVRYHELITRLKKVLTRTISETPKKLNYIDINGLEIDTVGRIVYFNQEQLLLTYLEYELLTLLAKNPGKVFTRDNLLDSLWHENQFYETRTVDVHIRRLRKKLEDIGTNPNLIETVRSVGYRMTSL